MKIDSDVREKVQLLANTIRVHSAEGVQQANSGHPGLPMGAAELAATLFSNHLQFNPQDPLWAGRDRFVLSAGHGSMLLYTALRLFGYDLRAEDLEAFRQWQSKTPGHPEFGITPGVETTTGPLGQGFANGVGMALSGKMLSARYGELFNYHTFGIVSDGDLMEGISSEAASLAGHLELGNLIYLYDDNQISIGGSTNVCFTESVAKRFEAFNWYVQEIDGHDIEQIDAALSKAKAEKTKPSIICARTTIGKGSPNRANSSGVHGSPLGDDELAATKAALNWKEKEAFKTPQAVESFCNNVIAEKQKTHKAWQERFVAWNDEQPELVKKYKAQCSREIPRDLLANLVCELESEDNAATRSLSGKAIQVIAKELPFFLGGSADLEPSNNTLIKDSEDLSAKNFAARNIRFGVREHAMGALVNGLAYGRDWIPYGATFLVFSDYMRPTIRLAALSHLQSLFIFTHDSFWVGEDGPTHQPIEHIEALRLIPNLYVFRPADGVEVAAAYQGALSLRSSPSALLFTRQKLSKLQREKDFEVEQVLKGGYVLSGKEVTELIVVATGSEVALASEAVAILASKGHKARVVSMPCCELFMEQPSSYRDAVLPKTAKKVAIEAGSTAGWQGRLGGEALCLGIDHFGASAPGKRLAEEFAFTPEKIAANITSWLKEF